MGNNNSLISKLYKKILMFTKPDYMDNKEIIEDFLNQRLKQNINKPNFVFKSINLYGVEVFSFGDITSEGVIVFIHGGAFVNEINMQHLIFCWYLARKINAHVIAPIYPLAPKHNVLECYDLFLDLYKKLIKKYSKITLMGDSAGGGFALSFSQYLNSINLNKIDKIIVFSPWVDISMSNPPYSSKNDPILGEIGLKEIGRSWAGDLSTHDYKVSPIFGDVSNQARTLIFAGEEEIFFKDIKKYYEFLIKENVDVKLISGKGMFHIYPLFPMPEAKIAFNEIINELSKDFRD